MTRTERRAADRRGTAPTGIRRVLGGVVPHRSVDPFDPSGPAADVHLPHRVPRAVPPPLA